MDEYLTRQQAADLLGVSRESVRLWVRDGRLTPDLELDGRHYFRRAHIEAEAKKLAPQRKGGRVQQRSVA